MRTFPRILSFSSLVRPVSYSLAAASAGLLRGAFPASAAGNKGEGLLKRTHQVYITAAQRACVSPEKLPGGTCNQRYMPACPARRLHGMHADHADARCRTTSSASSRTATRTRRPLLSPPRCGRRTGTATKAKAPRPRARSPGVLCRRRAFRIAGALRERAGAGVGADVFTPAAARGAGAVADRRGGRDRPQVRQGASPPRPRRPGS